MVAALQRIKSPGQKVVVVALRWMADGTMDGLGLMNWISGFLRASDLIRRELY